MDSAEKEGLQQAVYDIVRLVPHGRATSYAAIARAAGYPSHSRLVGRMMAGCSDEGVEGVEGVPAHRVVNSQGVLSGRAAFGAPDRMQSLLESEGVAIVNHRIQNWKRIFWSPIDEI